MCAIVSQYKFKGHLLITCGSRNTKYVKLFCQYYIHSERKLIYIKPSFIYRCTFGNLVVEKDDVNDLAANTITVLFFTHCITKFVYFAARSKLFYR